MKAKAALACTFPLFFILFSIHAFAATYNTGILGGAYDELLPSIVRGRPLVFSGKTRWEYDDNIYYEEDDVISSWKFLLEPKVDYHLLAETTYLGLFYQLSYRWTEERIEDQEDLSHDVGVTLNHMFTNTFELRLRELYRKREDQIAVAEQIEIIEVGGLVEDVPRRRDIDESYERNDFSASGVLSASERLNLIGSFTHMWIDYEDDAISINRDRTEYTAGARAEFVWRAQTNLSLGARYQDVDYDQDIRKVDSETYTYYAGINHRFSMALTGSLNAGWQDRTYDPYTIEVQDGEDIYVEERDQTSPYVDLSVSAPLSETFISSLGYRYNISETDESLFLSQKTQVFYLSMTNKFTPRFSVRFNGIMQFGDFDIDVARVPGAREDMSEDTIQFAFVFRYRIKENWFAETGWRYIDVDSDFPINSYERNRTFVGLNAVF